MKEKNVCIKFVESKVWACSWHLLVVNLVYTTAKMKDIAVALFEEQNMKKIQ